MFTTQELEILALSEYRLLELPAVSRRAQQAREVQLERSVTAEHARSTLIRRLRQALTRVSEQRATPRTKAGRI